MFFLRMLLCIALFLVLPYIVAARQLTFADFQLLELPTDAQLSPDGRSIAATVVRYDFHDNNLLTSMLLIDVQTGQWHRGLAQ